MKLLTWCTGWWVVNNKRMSEGEWLSWLIYWYRHETVAETNDVSIGPSTIIIHVIAIFDHTAAGHVVHRLNGSISYTFPTGKLVNWFSNKPLLHKKYEGQGVGERAFNNALLLLLLLFISVHWPFDSTPITMNQEEYLTLASWRCKTMYYKWNCWTHCGQYSSGFLHYISEEAKEDWSFSQPRRRIQSYSHWTPETEWTETQCFFG